MHRTILVTLAMVAAEVAWALLCAVELPQTSTYLVVFYAVLAAASAVFFVPGLAEGRARPAAAQSASPETNR